jgi:uncharacterized protein YggE
LGTGQVRVTPNRATVMLAVETRGATAAAASVANARVQRAVIDTLRAMGLEGSAVSTSDFSVSPDEDPEGTRPRRSGYVARNALSVEIASLGRVGPIIDAALARGATSAGQIVFRTSAADSAQQAALAAAATKASRQAAALATALGGSLGALIQATTNTRGEEFEVLGYGLEATRAPFAIGTPIAPGELTIEVRILARWRFIPK